MKISEVIDILTESKEKHGDGELYVKIGNTLIDDIFLGFNLMIVKDEKESKEQCGCVFTGRPINYIKFYE